MTQEEKAKAYDEVLGRAKSLVDFCSDSELKTLKFVFPELKENEDERIRNVLIGWINLESSISFGDTFDGFSKEQILAWLERQGDYSKLVGEMKKRKELLSKEKENATSDNDKLSLGGRTAMLEELLVFVNKKQDEQKPADEVEPKFHKGDWVIDKQGIVHQVANVVENATNHTYGYDIVGGGYFNDNTEDVRLWNISDAKKGDVLHSTGFHNDCIFIFNGLDNWKFDEPNGDRAVATGYCCLSVLADNMEFGMQGPDCVEVNTVKPATKEQCDVLFAKMKESGYEWDADKKELKKIEQNPTWSKEDKHWMQKVIDFMNHPDLIKATPTLVKDTINWLKSLKDRAQPQSKQEWSEEDW